MITQLIPQQKPEPLDYDMEKERRGNGQELVMRVGKSNKDSVPGESKERATNRRRGWSDNHT